VYRVFEYKSQFWEPKTGLLYIFPALVVKFC
jgi:hypothetical protein